MQSLSSDPLAESFALTHEMILASAGSGKTWQLTNRYIALMALQLRSGQPIAPERILAATFTVKAAGEFFSAILEKLAKAALDPKERANLSADSSDPLAPVLRSLDGADYTRLLRAFITRMPSVFLGTLDSFYARLLRTFPAEFGLSGDFSTLDEHSTTIARAHVYEQVFSSRTDSKGQGDENQRAFLEAFRRVNFGKNSVPVSSQLDAYIETVHELYLSAPDAAVWGQRSAIWGDEKAWRGEDIDVAAEAEKLRKAISAAEGRGENINRTYWDQFLEEIVEYQLGAGFPTRINYVAERVFPIWADLCEGQIELKFNRTEQHLGRDVCQPLRRIFEWIIAYAFEEKIEETQAVRNLLERYEESYSKAVRWKGQLTFQDVQFILAGRGGAGFTQNADDDAKLRIDYRLDARYDHWLLDEFQDTNHLQWSVIENLIDEVVQDTSGTRSLFQVGDLKQAIYAFRGGDTRLFSDIAARYNAHGEVIHQRNLDMSWRSGHDIIAPVNQVFRDKDALSALDLPQSAIDRWPWNDHVVSPKGEAYEGITYYLNPLAEDGSQPKSKPEEVEETARLIAGILEEINPIQRGISCAILTQSNKAGQELVDAVRTYTDIPVISESEVFIASDNPLNRALVSLFQLAAHPADRFAWEHLRLGPLVSWLIEEDVRPWKLSQLILQSVYSHGFEATAREWIDRIVGYLPHPEDYDPFTRDRAEKFCLAARHHDETGDRDVDEFLTYLSTYSIREGVAEDAVQVMTIHKSKGLTFDAVILPELDGNGLDITRSSIAVQRDAQRHVQWILYPPKKDLCQVDPVLSAHITEAKSDTTYDSLCKFYVAMTRASRANYLIAKPRGKSATSSNFIALLEDVLATYTFEEGEDITFSGVTARLRYVSNTKKTNTKWYEGHHRKEAKKVEETAPQALAPSLARPFTRRRAPSESPSSTVDAEWIFGRGGFVARDIGHLVHAMMEDITWSDEIDWQPLESDWRDRHGDAPNFDSLLAQMREFLTAPAVQTALARPEGPVELWREKPFEILLANEWVSGVFDRVVIQRDSAGRAVAATVLDYKTDRVSTEAEIATAVEFHRPQIESYRAVLQQIFKLPPENVQGYLLFTQVREVRKL